MIVGIGIDIVELKRISDAQQRNSKFSERILTDQEHQYFLKLTSRRQTEYLAGRFAAKEAFSKAIGSGIGKKVSWHDIEILADENGKPNLVCNITNGNVFLSISHSKEYAVANVIIEE